MTEDTKNAAGIRDEKAAGFPWPDGKRCALTLTFDIDAETMWLVKDPKNAERPVTLSAPSCLMGLVPTTLYSLVAVVMLVLSHL